MQIQCKQTKRHLAVVIILGIHREAGIAMLHCIFQVCVWSLSEPRSRSTQNKLIIFLQ